LKTRLIVVNILLAAGIGALGWQLNVRWKQAEAERQANLNVKVKPVTVVPAAPAPKPESATPAQYAQVAEKNLFSTDRNPTIVIEPVKVEAPKPMPSLPIVYGVMGLPSGMKAIMAEKSGQQSRSVRTGDTIGDFKVLALDAQTVKFEWNGKEVVRRIDELVDRSNSTPGGQGNSGPAAPPPPTPVAAAAAPPPSTTGPPQPGATANSDGSYSLTDKDGKKWILTRTPFGVMRVPDTRGGR
jgi:hypothetical protein